MTNDDFITYSVEGNINRALFLSEYNCINIFIEDTGKEYLYETIFDRMFANQLKIDSIFPTGGKPGMKQAFHDYGTHLNGVPNLYLMDANFDFLLDKDIMEGDNFLYLDSYNIECYFLDKDVTIEFMKTKIKQRKVETANLLQYDKWYLLIYKQFIELFLIFMVVQKENSTEKNVGQDGNKFLNDDGYVNTDKVQNYKAKVRAQIPSFDDTFLWCREQVHIKYNNQYSKVICGKYVLKSLYRYLLHISNVKFKYDELFIYLVGKCDLSSLNFIKERIRALCA